MSTTTALHVACRGRLLSRFTKTKVTVCPSHSRLFLSSVRSSAAELQDEEWEYPTATAQQQKSLPLTCTSSHPLSLEAPRGRETDDNEGEHHASPSELVYTGNHRMPITSTMHIVTPEEGVPRGTWPVFRLMVRRLLVHSS